MTYNVHVYREDDCVLSIKTQSYRDAKQQAKQLSIKSDEVVLSNDNWFETYKGGKQVPSMVTASGKIMRLYV